MNRLLITKVARVVRRKADALLGRLYPLEDTLAAMTLRAFELHLELTNLCNANCVFCPYQYQSRPTEFMRDEVFAKAVADYVSFGGGSVGLTPIVGDALIDPKFLVRVHHLRSLPAIDRIWVTTNALLMDKFGIEAILDSGLTAITISTAGFDEAMYRRVYRNASYERMRRNVTELVEKNAARSTPLHITIGLRPDRSLEEVLAHRDFQPILAHAPELDFTWAYTSAGGRITRDQLPDVMKLRVVTSRREACVNLYNGPIVLPDGTVMACSCVAAMDALSDLGIGNVLENGLHELWTGEKAQRLRASFSSGELNPTCAGCDMYRNLELYRTQQGRRRADLNRARFEGRAVMTRHPPSGPFAGG